MPEDDGYRMSAPPLDQGQETRGMPDKYFDCRNKRLIGWVVESCVTQQASGYEEGDMRERKPHVGTVETGAATEAAGRELYRTQRHWCTRTDSESGNVTDRVFNDA